MHSPSNQGGTTTSGKNVNGGGDDCHDSDNNNISNIDNNSGMSIFFNFSNSCINGDGSNISSHNDISLSYYPYHIY